MPPCAHGLADPRMCPDCRRAARQAAPVAPIERATDELVALALAVRPDWREADVRADLANASMIGLTWPQQLVGLARLMADPCAVSRELIPPHQRQEPTPDPDVVIDRTARGVEAARALLEERDAP
ncbi:hypothetical protein [Nonomuraea dietziae]|uniref:hypothetical protein n=1 Tax=Nonomuraea dietziae TaxID=65515 RepID=UPI0034382C24